MINNRLFKSTQFNDLNVVALAVAGSVESAGHIDSKQSNQNIISTSKGRL